MVTATDSSIGRSPHHRTRLKRLGADTLADGRSFVGGLFYTDWITLVLLSPAATQSLALIVQELCTNATHYGAYSTPGGRVAVLWSIEQTGNEPVFVFRWQRGGPRVVPPDHTSFGTTLLKVAISGAKTPPDIDYAPEGFTYTFEAPLAGIVAISN